MDEKLEDFCREISSSQQTCEELQGCAEKLVRLLKQRSKFHLGDWKLLGGINTRGLELTIYNNNNKSEVLKDWEEILLLNSDVNEDNIDRTASSLRFIFNDIPCKVFVAAQYDTEKLISYLQNSNNPLDYAEYLEAELSIVRNDWINSQTEFTKDIIRLANYWNYSILWDKNIPERTLMFELLAMKTAREELEKTTFPHHKKTFVKFLQHVQYLQQQVVIFEDFYAMNNISTNRAPLFLDPVNPTNNLCRNIHHEFYTFFSKCATTTLQIFDSGSENLQQIFFPQPMLWNLLEYNRLLLKPKNYLVGVSFYNSTIPKTVIRARSLNKDLIKNMVNVLSTHINNTLSKLPDISDQDVQEKVTIFLNKMDNDEHRKWIPLQESHDDRAVTLMVPIIGRNKGLFLSFDV